MDEIMVETTRNFLGFHGFTVRLREGKPKPCLGLVTQESKGVPLKNTTKFRKYSESWTVNHTQRRLRDD